MLAETTLVVVASMARYAALGGLWNLGNVSFKKVAKEGGEKMIWRKLAQALALGAGAGALVAVWGQPADPGMFEVAMATIVPLADKLYNAYEAGISTYHDADDGDDEKVDEVRAAVADALAEFSASGAELPNTDGPQKSPDEVDPETGAPIDMANDDEPQADQHAEKRREAPTTEPNDTKTVQSGP